MTGFGEAASWLCHDTKRDKGANMSVVMRGRNTGTHTVELVHESGSVIHTMAPKDNGGDGSTFSPTDLCAVSLGACSVTIMSQYAANHGIQLHNIEFELIKEMSPAPRRIQRITVKYRLMGVISDLEFEKIVAAGKACPVRVTFGERIELVEKFERV
jgi:putative redox protein